ncbi:MAG TPA: cysteine hydrolase, partial [Stenotrophomonas sp.]|nr:cysteine hydrolase [Stenotrophomonas sp.]
ALPICKGAMVIAKDNVSVFAGASGPVLEQALKDAGIDTLIIAGLQTHACVAGAARDAAPKGLNVIVSSDATATRDLDLHDGSRVAHASLHAAALASIEDTYGTVLATDQILALPVR